MNDILNLLNKSKTPYHLVSEVKAILNQNGFIELNEKIPFKISKNKKYYVTRNDSALIAFTTGDEINGYNIIASHTDSPCFKVKFGKTSVTAGTTKLPVEQYGGGLRYSWLDRPLKLCGRLCGEKDGKIVSTLYESESNFVIPSVAIHMRRNANDSLSVNPQVDCQPLYALSNDADKFANDLREKFDGNLLDCDLFLVCDQQPFYCGANNEFLCSPRVDNLTSCFSSLFALINAKNEQMVNVIYLADNEEVGSRTKQGAGSKFLYDTLYRINNGFSLSEECFYTTLANSFMVSCDNAHAVHPNHPELSDMTDSVLLGKGVVIKHHGNQNYTTDAISSATLKNILARNNIPYCDFYMRADMPCGGTLGAISSSNLSISSIDIGMGQLAMHSAVETFAIKDYEIISQALTCFLNENK
ncbi:MAG: M18 family aminopeptidase [Clostridia bacterium]|nr:M18 family aminopeptidase [Clostridia bacterium]